MTTITLEELRRHVAEQVFYLAAQAAAFRLEVEAHDRGERPRVPGDLTPEQKLVMANALEHALQPFRQIVEASAPPGDAVTRQLHSVLKQARSYAELAATATVPATSTRQ